MPLKNRLERKSKQRLSTNECPHPGEFTLSQKHLISPRHLNYSIYRDRTYSAKLFGPDRIYVRHFINYGSAEPLVWSHISVHMYSTSKGFKDLTFCDLKSFGSTRILMTTSPRPNPSQHFPHYWEKNMTFQSTKCLHYHYEPRCSGLPRFVPL